MTTVTKYMRCKLEDISELPDAIEQIDIRLGMMGIGMFDTVEEMDKDAKENETAQGDTYDIIITFEARKTDAKEHTNV